MQYIEFEKERKYDVIFLGRVAIDFNPAYSDAVKEEFKPLKKVHYFEKFVGGSPANIACGIRKHGMTAGFFAMVSDDQFGDYVIDYFDEHGIDTSHITRAKHGEKIGLTFTEMLSPSESSILMYRNQAADLSLHVDCIDEDYIKQAKAILGHLLRRVRQERRPSRQRCWRKEITQRLSLILTTVRTTGKTQMRFLFITRLLPSRQILSWVPGKSLTSQRS